MNAMLHGLASIDTSSGIVINTDPNWTPPVANPPQNTTPLTSQDLMLNALPVMSTLPATSAITDARGTAVAQTAINNATDYTPWIFAALFGLLLLAGGHK